MRKKLWTWVPLLTAFTILLQWINGAAGSRTISSHFIEPSLTPSGSDAEYGFIVSTPSAMFELSSSVTSAFVELTPSPSGSGSVGYAPPPPPPSVPPPLPSPSPTPPVGVDPCLLEPCQNSGECITLEDSYQCNCSSGFHGMNCETGVGELSGSGIVDPCLSDPCQNSGDCATVEDSNQCNCGSGFSGMNCEVATCDPNPCENGGSCVLRSNSQVCMCLPGFTGGLCDTATRLLPYGALYGDLFVPNFDDGVSDAIPIPRGFRFFDRTHYKAYICTNGLISLTKPFFDYYARLFPAENRNDWLYSRNVFAPFWGDIDIRSDGQISYHVYEATLPTDAHIIESVNSEVRGYNSKYSDFSATWVLVATWHKVPNYPYGSHYYRNYGYYRSDQALKRNTFQAVLATSGQHSFAMSRYDDGGLEWADSSTKGVIGYSAEGGKYFFNHPLSQTNDIVTIGRLAGRLTYVVSLQPTVYQLAGERCLKWYDKDKKLLGSEFINSLLSTQPCPCQWWQAWFDDMFVFYWGTFCAVSVFPTGSHGQECCYSIQSSSFGALLTGPPDGGSVDRFHESINANLHNAQDVKPYEDCCLISGHCDMYYERRPSDTCERYEPPFRGWIWGDPHMMTMDGKKYTFNGWGEYILMKTVNDTFVLEGRTQPVVNSTATIFTAFAMAEFDALGDFMLGNPSSSVVHVELKGDKMVVKVCCNGSLGQNVESSWTDYTSDYEALDNVSSVILTNAQLRRPDNKTLLVVFPSYISVSVKLQKSLLAVLFSAPPRYQGATSGLLGRWDKNITNDFIARNGTEISINSTDRQIHNISQTWQVLTGESLFFYDGTNLSTYFHPDHQPIFLDELVQGNISQGVITACGGDSSCIFDTIQTGDMEIGMQSRETSDNFDEQLKTLRNNPPVVSGDAVLYATLSQQVIYSVTVSDPNDTFTVELQGKPPPTSDYTFNGTVNTFTFTWTPRTKDPVQLMFVANDSQGAVRVHHPVVRLCACALDLNAVCVNSSGDGGTDRFLIQGCLCGTGWEGDFCDMDINGCEAVSCPEGSNCQDNPAPQVGANCSDCPVGTEAIDGKCSDIDECNTTTHGCSHQCVNQHSNYTCKCNNGYKLLSDGRTCQDINECLLSSPPCHHQCENNNGSYSCRCNVGYRLDVDNSTCLSATNCSRMDCDQLCAVANGSENCSCLPGYEIINGTLCQDINECETNKHNCDHICLNIPGSFSCNCSSGYKLSVDGHSCEDTNECLESLPETPCPITSQTCTNTDGAFNCSCAIGQVVVNGTCSVIDNCASSPCTNGGTCRRYLPGQFICDCRLGYTGTLCETDTDECESSPCLYGGTCLNGVGRYTCQCPHGLAGAQCEQDVIDECDSSPCVNRATCQNQIFNFSCVCIMGTSGRRCETDMVNECSSSPCPNAGYCTDLPGGFHCQCLDGFSGSDCETEIDECSSQPCINGTCIDKLNVYLCQCQPGYTGEQCETEIDECSSQPCINGTCIDQLNVYLCQCQPGYTGEQCETDTDECESSPCLYGGTCLNGVGRYTCQCPRGLAGGQCEQDVIDECDSSPCVNPATCQNQIFNFSCVCIMGTSGRLCETDTTNECASFPCQNGGDCTNLLGGFHCQCIDGFSGSQCEIDIDECSSQPCLNGGTCSDRINTYLCNCMPTYTGEHCETEVDECLSNPCKNGGTCTDQLGAYECDCPCGYEGFHCDKDTDECNTTKQGCEHDCDQLCINQVGSFSCECDKGYSLKVDRKSCTVVPCESEQADCQTFATCVDDVFNCGSESYIKEFFDGLCSLTQKGVGAAGLWVGNVTDCLSTELRSFWEESYLFGVSDPVVSDCRRLSRKMREAQKSCFRLLLCETPFTTDVAELIVADAFRQSEISRVQLLELLETCPNDTGNSFEQRLRDEGFTLCFSLSNGLSQDDRSNIITLIENEFSAEYNESIICPSKSDSESGRKRRSLDWVSGKVQRHRRDSENTTTPTPSDGGGFGFSSNTSSACKNRSQDVENATLSCPVCGDGVVEIPDEECDDGNNKTGDGCAANCTNEKGFDCDSPLNGKSVCYNVTCGDGVRVTGEECDTGGMEGCDPDDCTVVDGFNCSAPSFAKSTCTPTCGDGIVAGNETCDDNNADSIDGCDSTCTVEVGYNCTKTDANGSSICKLLPNYNCTSSGQCFLCGNGVLELPETCDDGKPDRGTDGCNGTCDIDELFECSGGIGEQSVCKHVSVDFDKTDDTTLDYATTYMEAREVVFLANPDLLDASNFSDTDWKVIVLTLNNPVGDQEKLRLAVEEAGRMKRIPSSNQTIIENNVTTTGNLSLTRDTGSAVSLRYVLLSVAYEHKSPDPGRTRHISLVVTDKNGNNASTVQVNVTFVGKDDSKPMVVISDNSVEFVEGSKNPVSVTNGTLTVNDTDHDFHQMESCNISLSPCPDCNEEELALNSTDAIAVTYNSMTGVLYLTGTASEAAYQSLMNKVTYINRASEPTRPLSRKVIFSLSDGENIGSAEVTITIIKVNDRPVVNFDGALSSVVSFEEGGDAVPIATTVNITDDSDQLIGATVTIDNGQTGDELQLSGNFSNIAVTFENNKQRLVLRGTSNATAYEEALRSVLFNNPNANPANVTKFTRNITIIVNDTLSASKAVYALVNVDAVNDRPVFHFGNDTSNYGSAANLKHSVIFTEDGDGTEVFPDSTTLTDVDSSNLSSASLILSGVMDGTSETITFNQTLASLYGIKITNQWNNGSSQLNVSLSGTSAVTNYRKLLLSATYRNSKSKDMHPGERNINATVVDDGDATSDPVTVSVTVNERNDPLEINLGVGFGQPDAIFFTEEANHISIVTYGFRFAIRDEDSSGASKATISLRTSPDGNLDSDEFLFRLSRTNDISFVSDGQMITLTGSASFSDYADAIGSLAYQSLAEEPTLYVNDTFVPVQRFIDIVVWDNGLNSSFTNKTFPAVATTATVTLTIELINDNIPVLSLVTVPQSCSADPNSNSRQKRDVMKMKLVPRKLNKTKGPPPVSSVSGFGPTRRVFGSSSVITVKFGSSTNQVAVSRPVDINRLLSFSPSVLSNLTYTGLWNDSRTLLIVFPKVPLYSEFVTLDDVQITFKEPEGHCDEFDVCQHHICHEDGLSCSVVGRYRMFGYEDTESFQPTDLKLYWILITAAFMLLVIVITMAVFAGRHQTRQYIGTLVTDERGHRSSDAKAKRKLQSNDVQTEEKQVKGTVFAHEKTDSQRVETITFMENRHEIVELGESETYLQNDPTVSSDQTKADCEQTDGMSLVGSVIRSGFSDGREMKRRQNND